MQFEDPPGKYDARSKVDHRAVAAELKARPGEWAIVRTGFPSKFAAATAASRIKAGHPVAYRPPGSFDALSRTVDSELRLYARYTGKDADHAGPDTP